MGCLGILFYVWYEFNVFLERKSKKNMNKTQKCNAIIYSIPLHRWFDHLLCYLWFVWSLLSLQSINIDLTNILLLFFCFLFCVFICDILRFLFWFISFEQINIKNANFYSKSIQKVSSVIIHDGAEMNKNQNKSHQIQISITMNALRWTR